MTTKPKKGKKRALKAWAVAENNGFIHDFSVTGKFYDVLQIHSTRTAADHLKRILGKGFKVITLTITYHV